MKTILSVPLMMLILFSGIRVQIASHYCKGNYSGTKVSLGCELATCGMEDHSGEKQSGDIFSTHCCDDVVSSYSVSTNCVPSVLDLLSPVQVFYHISLLKGEPLFNHNLPIQTLSDTNMPPGCYSPYSVEQQAICVFLI